MAGCLRHPGNLRVAGDDFLQLGLGAPGIDRELVIDGKFKAWEPRVAACG
jgi:hypothetical protein